MDKVQALLKDNWQYVLGAVVGLYLIFRYMSGGTASGGGSGDLAAYYQAAATGNAAQIAANSQNAQLQAQVDQQNQAAQLARDTLQSQTQIGYLNAQSAMADAVGKSAAGVVGALYAPTVAAINASGYENAATVTAAANVAAAGFGAQATIFDSSTKAISAWGEVTQGIGSIMSGAKSGLQTVSDGANEAFGTYMTGGMSQLGKGRTW